MKKKFAAALAVFAVAFGIVGVAAGPANAYTCGKAVCGQFDNFARSGVGVIDNWKGKGANFYTRGYYDVALVPGANTRDTMGWADTDGFYVGPHYRVRISIKDPNTGALTDKGYFNYGQWYIGNSDYYFTDVYNCGC